MKNYLMSIELEKKIVTKVADSLLSLNEYNTLSSHTSKSALSDKLRLFFSLLLESLKSKKSHIIIDTLPWMFHTYKAQGYSYDLFFIELDIWSKVLKDEQSLSKSKELLELLDSIKESFDTFVKKANEYQSTNIEVPLKYREIQKEFKEAILKGDIDSSKEIIDKNIASYQELHDFSNHIILPSMFSIGIEWENGDVSVAEEHLASSIVIETLAIIYTKLVLPDIHKGVVIVGAIENEFHEIGAMMLANTLELDGWDVKYLGPNVEDENFLEHIRNCNPTFVALSLAMPFNIINTKNLITKIHALEMQNIPKIMVGGNAFRMLDSKASDIGADIYLRNTNEAVAQANIWNLV